MMSLAYKKQEEMKVGGGGLIFVKVWGEIDICEGGGSSLTHHPYFRETRGGLIYIIIFLC